MLLPFANLKTISACLLAPLVVTDISTDLKEEDSFSNKLKKVLFSLKFFLVCSNVLAYLSILPALWAIAL